MLLIQYSHSWQRKKRQNEKVSSHKLEILFITSTLAPCEQLEAENAAANEMVSLWL